MSPRLDRGEYWLLANAVEYGLPLGVLTLPEWPRSDGRATIDVVLNKRGHGLGTARLAGTLLRMLQRSWIELSRNQQPISLPDRDEMLRLLAERGRRFDETAHYALTPEGGSIWEAFARPDWDRYITHSFDLGGPESDETELHEAIAADPKLLKRYVGAVAHETPIDAGSEVFSEFNPWEATYWKSLPAGFRCLFRVRRNEPAAYRPPGSQWLRDRWCPWL